MGLSGAEWGRRKLVAKKVAREGWVSVWAGVRWVVKGRGGQGQGWPRVARAGVAGWVLTL